MLRVLSPEARLLFATVNGREASESIVRASQGPVDWSRFVRIADVEKASPVIWPLLYTTPGVYVPEPLSTHLRRMAHVSDFNMLFLEQRLGESVDALAARGIPAMLLKGAALAVTVYPSFEARPMGDLDLLVPTDRAEEAQAVLEATGWASPHDPSLVAFYEEHHHLEPLANTRGAMATLEVHRSLFHTGHPFRYPVADVWARAETVERGRRRYLVPSALDRMLHLSLHFAWSHGMRSGAWRAFRDARALIDSGLDWEAFLRLAHETLATTSAYWTLRLARSVADVAVPNDVLRSLRPPIGEGTMRRLERHFAYGLLPLDRAFPSRNLGNARWEAAILPAWSGHGAARPWDRSEDLLRPTDEGERGGLLERSIDRLEGWARYARAMVLPGPSMRAPRPTHTIGP